MPFKRQPEAEQGMPCVMSCIYAAREFFESGGMEVEAVEVVEDIENERRD